jgi:uncharacterized protein YecE (DUF72 family)
VSHCYIGCPIWTHSSWFGHIYPPKSKKINPLSSYSQYFNSVEGNSSFYHLPDIPTLETWAEAVPSDFKFTLKFPSTISHQGDLGDCHLLVEQALANFSVLGNKLGSLMLQLPASFSPKLLKKLEFFLSLIPEQFTVAVEVRHLDFFAKGDNERQLNQLLQRFHADRIIMDTRALFACNADDPEVEDASLVREVQSKKPRVPTNVVTTGTHPIVRFVGHPQIAHTKSYYQPWLPKIKQWLDEGKTPSLFFHMPDNKDAPWLAQTFIKDFNATFPLSPLPVLELSNIGQDQGELF